MSGATHRRLSLLPERASTGGRKVSPMQIAAQIPEDALTGMQEPRLARCSATMDRTGISNKLYIT